MKRDICGETLEYMQRLDLIFLILNKFLVFKIKNIIQRKLSLIIFNKIYLQFYMSKYIKIVSTIILKKLVIYTVYTRNS